MKKIWDIHGGIHPEQNKSQSNQSPITAACIPPELVFPLSQHIGAPATAIVSVGQHVLKGEAIAVAKGFVSVPVHASTSGEIVAIEERQIPHPSGMAALCIVLKPDGNDQWGNRQGIEDYTSLEKTELLNRIREAGIAGMGGAGFPSAVKLSTREDQPIETLIINGTECEPYITSDDVLMRERAEDIIAGTKILQHIISPTVSTLIGVEDNKPESIAALEKAAAGSNIEIVSFPTKYPSGGEKQLIQILTGKQVPSGGLPAQVGIVCQNVGTTAAIHKAVNLGEPLISRVTTVTGFACSTQKNFEVLLGTPINHLLELCGYDEKQCSRLIMGGPMMGFTLENAAVPVVKTTNCILAPSIEELPPPQAAQACIRCGMCAEACPVSLLPQQLYWFARGKEYEKLEAHNLMDCIECGACSYVCPSNIPLVQYYRASKADIRAIKQDHIKAEHSKARFEARKERIEKQEAEKEAKRQARKAASQARATKSSSAGEAPSNNEAGTTGEGDVIQQAIERAKAKRAGNAEQANAAPVVDAAQAAIERAKAKRSGFGDEEPTRESLEQALANVEKRLAGAKKKLADAEEQGSDKLDAFKIGVKKTAEKHQKAQQALADFNANNPAPASTDKNATADDAAKTTLTGDAAQDAIARALSKREAASSMTDEQRLQNAVDSLTKRLTKTKEKLSTAQANEEDTVTILAETVDKLELKLADAKQAFAEFKEQN